LNNLNPLMKKSYKSPVEEEMRYKIFCENLEIARKMTEDTNGVTQFGVTPFSDLSKEEFAHVYLMKKTPDFRVVEEKDISTNMTGDTGKTWDWRYVKSQPGKTAWDGSCVSPVYNQGQCGSCWAFSATEQIESMWCLQGHSGGRADHLSMQQIVDCDRKCYGCNGGWNYLAMEYVIDNKGIDSYASYPYTAEDGPCRYKPADKQADIKGWGYVGRGNEGEMLGYIQRDGPLSICVDATTWQYYSGGVVTCAACGRSLDHCVQLVGYGEFQGKKVWHIRNSWGTSWGYGGYLYVEYGCDACGLTTTPITAVSA